MERTALERYAVNYEEHRPRRSRCSDDLRIARTYKHIIKEHSETAKPVFMAYNKPDTFAWRNGSIC